MNEMLIQGLTIMCIGMGVVLSFLCLLIVSMHIMSKVIGKLNEMFPESVAQLAGANPKKLTTSNDEEIALAIVSAMFRAK